MRRILIVDDDEALNECIRELLGDMGYEARGVLSGVDCLTVLSSGEYRPDVVLLDIMMEPMDGWETLRGIRQLRATATTPVIMVTGKVPTADELREFVPMISGYLLKPFAIQNLGQEIERVSRDVGTRDDMIKSAGSSRSDARSVEDLFRLRSSVHILEHLCIEVGQEIVDPAILARDRRRMDELDQKLLAKP